MAEALGSHLVVAFVDTDAVWRLEFAVRLFCASERLLVHPRSSKKVDCLAPLRSDNNFEVHDMSPDLLRTEPLNHLSYRRSEVGFLGSCLDPSYLKSNLIGIVWPP